MKRTTVALGLSGMFVAALLIGCGKSDGPKENRPPSDAAKLKANQALGSKGAAPAPKSG